MTKWNQKTIHEWGVATFGEQAKDSLGLAIRMGKEAVELMAELRDDNEANVFEESADVSIVLLQVANSINFDIAVEAEDEFNGALYQSTTELIQNEIDASRLLGKKSMELIAALFSKKETEAKLIIIQLIAVMDVIEELFEFDLDIQVGNKMEVNVRRTWKQSRDGSFQHV